MSEATEQAHVIQWAAYMEHRWPELHWLHHIPNGGARDRVTGAMLKRQGVKPGVPDLYLPCARGGYHGLYIEMKNGRNGLTKAQKAFRDYATAQGYRVQVCYSADQAIDTITKYIGA